MLKKALLVMMLSPAALAAGGYTNAKQCESLTKINPYMFLSTAGIEEYSPEFKNLSTLIHNGGAFLQHFSIKNGYCYATVNLSGTVNGNSINKTLTGMIVD